MAKNLFATKTQRHEGYNLKKILCVFVTLWQVIPVPVYVG
jgi:hypothetical protein